MASNTLKVKILSPIQTIFDGEALSVSSTNSTGNFDILPFHANFITLVQKNPIILRVKSDKEKNNLSEKTFKGLFDRDVTEVKYDFDMAIVYTKDNFITIYTNIQTKF